MSVIQSKSVVTKTTTATLKADDIKKLIAADMGVDPRCVSLDFKLQSSDWDGPGYSNHSFSSLEVKVVE
jgi:hypothetical protein